MLVTSLDRLLTPHAAVRAAAALAGSGPDARGCASAALRPSPITALGHASDVPTDAEPTSSARSSAAAPARLGTGIDDDGAGCSG